MPDSPSGPEPSVGRRHLLRGGAVLAGAAGAVALAAVPRPAAAANGDPVDQGELNDATSTTSIRIDGTTGDTDSATLSLLNADGPSLQLQALASDWAGALTLGQIANTEVGPSIGIVDPDGYDTVSFLATEFDLLAQPQTLALSPQRVVDTRYSAQRGNIINTPANSFDSAGRLLAGKTMQLALADATGAVTLQAAFLNVVSTGSLAGGYFTVFPAGTSRPTASTLNFATGQTIANGCFAAVAAVGDDYAVSVYTNVTSHVVVDLNGVIMEEAAGSASARTGARTKANAPGTRKPRASRRKLAILGRAR